MPIPVVRLDEPARDFYLQHGGAAGATPPARKADTDAYQRNLALLVERLARIAELRQAPDDPYFIKPATDPDHFLWVEIGRADLLTPRLVREVHAAVCAMDDGFRVEVCDALGHLESRFNVFVEQETIYAYAEEESVLASLGLAEEAFRVDH